MKSIVLASGVAVLGLVTLVGCERKAKQPAAGTSDSAPAGVSAQPAGPGVESASIDWSRVQAPADKLVVMEHYTHLARYADAWHKGAKPTIRLTFRPPASVCDDAGNCAPFTPEGWKGVLAMVQESPDGKSAIRALPAREQNYADKLGAVRRNAYVVSVDGEAFVFEFARSLEDDSNG